MGIQVDALPLDFNGKIVLLEPKQDGQPAGSDLDQRGGRLMIRSAQAAGTRAAQAALNPAPDTDLDRFLLIEETRRRDDRYPRHSLRPLPARTGGALMTGLANATGAPALTRPGMGPFRPGATVQRSQHGWQRYRDLKPRESAAPAAPPPAGEPPAPPQPKKGKRPTHEFIRVLQVNGRKAYQPVAVVWLRESARASSSSTPTSRPATT